MSKDIKFTFPKEKTKELIDRSYDTTSRDLQNTERITNL